MRSASVLGARSIRHNTGIRQSEHWQFGHGLPSDELDYGVCGYTANEQEYPCDDDLFQNEDARLVREAGMLILIIDGFAQYARISSDTLWNQAGQAC